MISERLQRFKYIFSDYIATNVAWVLFNIVRFYFLDTNRLEYGSLTSFLTAKQLVLGQIFLPLLMLCIFYLSGYYNKVFLKSRLQEIVSTFCTSFIGMLVIYFIVIINDNVPDRLHSYELMAILLGIMFFCCLFISILHHPNCDTQYTSQNMEFQYTYHWHISGSSKTRRETSYIKKIDGF